MAYWSYLGICAGYRGLFFPLPGILGNHDDLGLFGDLAWVIWGYLGIWRELSGVIFPTSWIFLGNHDDNNRSGDTARYAGGGTKSVSIIMNSAFFCPNVERARDLKNTKNEEAGN